MSRFDDDNPFDPAPRKKPTTHEIGQPLDALSVDELEERMALLRTEVERLETAKKAKEASRVAAASFFKS